MKREKSFNIRIMMQKEDFYYKEGKRYNNINKRILKWLIKNDFVFSVGITNNCIQAKPQLIKVFLKPTHLIETETLEQSNHNRYLNEQLMIKLKKLRRKK